MIPYADVYWNVTLECRLFATGLKKARAEGKKCHEKTREGTKSVVGLLERMNRGKGIKGLDDKSSGMEILIADAFAKINPTDPLIFVKQTARRKRN
jgi:hypothetical protein